MIETDCEQMGLADLFFRCTLTFGDIKLQKLPSIATHIHPESMPLQMQVHTSRACISLSMSFLIIHLSPLSKLDSVNALLHYTTASYSTPCKNVVLKKNPFFSALVLKKNWFKKKMLVLERKLKLHSKR